MKSRKSLKRLGIVYALLMTIGGFICLFLVKTSNVIPVAPETVELAQQTQQKQEMVALTENTVMGDVYDRDGTLLVSASDNGMVEYRHDKAYSNTIGFATDSASEYLLLGNFSDDLYYADGGTNKGRNLTLTLDAEIQEFAYELINVGKGEKGSIVVLDAKTGAVVAMANNPSFSMQEVLNGTLEVSDESTGEVLFFPLRNPTRPGSIYKVVTSIGILEKNLENLVISDEYKGIWERDGVKIKNSKEAAYGELTYKDALIKSSNIYFGRMAYEHLGWECFEDISQNRCKIGNPQMLDFGRVLSQYDYVKDEAASGSIGGIYDSNQELAQAAYGYSDITLTSLQAAMIVQGIANDGIMCTPYMLNSICKTEGNEISEGMYHYSKGQQVESVSAYTYGKGMNSQITSKEVCDKITNAMLGVYEEYRSRSLLEGVEEGGLVVDGIKYPIAIKTGTADIDESKEDYNNIWMVSFAPANAPQYVVVVNRYGVNGGFGAHLIDDVLKMYQVLFEQ